MPRPLLLLASAAASLAASLPPAQEQQLQPTPSSTTGGAASTGFLSSRSKICDAFEVDGEMLCAPALFVPAMGKCGTNSLQTFTAMHPCNFDKPQSTVAAGSSTFSTPSSRLTAVNISPRASAA